MLKELRVDDAAPWKQRYRLPITYAVQIATIAGLHGVTDADICLVLVETGKFPWRAACFGIHCNAQTPHDVCATISF